MERAKSMYAKKSQYSLNFWVMLSGISYLHLHKNLNGIPLDKKYCTCIQIFKLIIVCIAVILVLGLAKKFRAFTWSDMSSHII